MYAITAQGLALLAENPRAINNRMLQRYESFTQFAGNKSQAPSEMPAPHPLLSQELPELDPLESFNQSYWAIQQSLADDLLEMLKQTKPTFFEKLVVDLLVAMGYGGSDEEIRKAVMKGSSDEGIDGVIKEYTLGLSHIYLQAKRWKDSTVGRPVVASFYGTMEAFRASKGVMITTSTFSEEARRFTEKVPNKLVLIDGKALVQLMLEYGVGLKTVDTYKIQALDLGYYELEKTALPAAHSTASI